MKCETNFENGVPKGEMPRYIIQSTWVGEDSTPLVAVHDFEQHKLSRPISEFAVIFGTQGEKPTIIPLPSDKCWRDVRDEYLSVV